MEAFTKNQNLLHMQVLMRMNVDSKLICSSDIMNFKFRVTQIFLLKFTFMNRHIPDSIQSLKTRTYQSMTIEILGSLLIPRNWDLCNLQ